MWILGCDRFQIWKLTSNLERFFFISLSGSTNKKSLLYYSVLLNIIMRKITSNYPLIVASKAITYTLQIFGIFLAIESLLSSLPSPPTARLVPLFHNPFLQPMKLRYLIRVCWLLGTLTLCAYVSVCVCMYKFVCKCLLVFVCAYMLLCISF